MVALAAINTPGGASRSLAAGGGGQGQTATYTLAGSATGYDLTSIVVYGGWVMAAADAQAYTITFYRSAQRRLFIKRSQQQSLPS